MLHYTILTVIYSFWLRIHQLSFRKKSYRHTSQTLSQNASYVQVTSSARVYENSSPEIQPINIDQTNEFQKMFEVMKRIEEISELHRASNSEVIDIGILRNDLHGNHAAYSAVQNCNRV